MKALPKKVYIAWQEEGTPNEFLGVATDYEALVVQGEKKRVGVYILKELKTAVNKTELV